MKIGTNTTLIKLFVVLVFISASVVSAQENENYRQMFVEAESYFLFEEYKDALPLYQRILQANQDNFNINYKIGVCYLNDMYQVSKSISYLEKAVEGVSEDSKPNNFREEFAPPEAYYYLGNAFRVNNRLNEASEAYEQFKLILDPTVYDVNLVDMQINACRIAAEHESRPIYFISENLGEVINDRFEELNPVVSGNEQVMAFTRKLQFYDAVFYTKKVNGKWTAPENLTPYFAVDGNTYTTGISYNGDEIYVYRSDDFDGNIYVSYLRNNRWSELQKLNNNINTKYWESHASISKDGRTLYFTSNREGGYGGLDIYKSERNRGGDWGPAVNLGPVINTRYNEDTPFITEDGNTLYFSSMGHYNMGDYDIFYSTRLSNGQWAKPLNLGYPVNTTGDDIFFVPVSDGAFAYYSKYIPEDSYGMADIYKLQVFTDLHPRKFILNGVASMEGIVSGDFSNYKAALVDLQTGEVIDQTRLNEDGTYSLNALSGTMLLTFEGDDIDENQERIYIPVDNESNIISHSTTLRQVSMDISEADTFAGPRPITGPELSLSVTSYNVTTDESIPIRIDLERNTNLQVITMLDGEVKNTEDFDITRRRFVYMLTPEPGTNILRFILADNEGNTTSKEVTVIYTPEPQSLEEKTVAQQILTDTNRYMGLLYMAEGNLAEYLQNIQLNGDQFETAADLYEYLLDHAPENGYTEDEVNRLMAGYMAQKDLNLFFREIHEQASDSLKIELDKVDFATNAIYTSGLLTGYLHSMMPEASFNYESLREALYQIASENRDPETLVDLLVSYAKGELAAFLDSIRIQISDYANTSVVADTIYNAAKSRIFPLADLEYALDMAAAELDMYFLSQGLEFISSDSLRQTMLNLNTDKLEIKNTSELIYYLLSKSDRNYDSREVLENIEKIRKDPYYYVDQLRRLLAERASGSLKLFLQEIDVRDLQLNTFESLIDYLMNQSQFQDYNREMVYQLLLDIIDLKNVAEFLDLLVRYADQRIVDAIQDTESKQFSTPIEVIQYLLSVADEYNYTERDLMRVLLKILLRKGPSAGGSAIDKGWLQSLDKPALITSLIVVNGIIIVFLIIFILRKKRKNE